MYLFQANIIFENPNKIAMELTSYLIFTTLLILIISGKPSMSFKRICTNFITLQNISGYVSPA